MSLRGTARRAGVFALALAGSAVGVAAQSATLERIEEGVRDGHTAQARALLQRWWESERPSASALELQRALWLRARLTEDPQVAVLIYRRLAIEFPDGPMSERARERLNEYEAASGLVRVPDHNGVEANGALVGLLGDGLSVATDPPEGDGRYAIQLAAFRDRARAFLLADSVLEAGPTPRVIGLERDQLARVRVGRYSNRDQAEAALELFRSLGLRGYLVGDVTSERRLTDPVGQDQPARKRR